MKRPGGTFSYAVVPLGTDEHGDWASAPIGSRFITPHDAGQLDHAAMFLAPRGHGWVAWWTGSGNAARLAIDICLPAVREGADWRYVDLELDVVALPDGTFRLLDEDEFEERCTEGWIDRQDATMATDAFAEVQRDLIEDADWISAGWQRATAETRRSRRRRTAR